MIRSAPPMVHSCVSNMSSPSEVVFAAFLGGFNKFAPRPMTRPPLWDGRSRFTKPSKARLPSHTALPCCCYIFAFSVSSFDCPWLLPCRFPSDAPGKHRLAFVAWRYCSTPFTTVFEARIMILTIDFYVLPRFSSTAHHLSPPAAIVHFHSRLLSDSTRLSSEHPIPTSISVNSFIAHYPAVTKRAGLCFELSSLNTSIKYGETAGARLELDLQIPASECGQKAQL